MKFVLSRAKILGRAPFAIYLCIHAGSSSLEPCATVLNSPRSSLARPDQGEKGETLRRIVMKSSPVKSSEHPDLSGCSSFSLFRSLNRFIGFLLVARVAYRTASFSIALDRSQETVENGSLSFSRTRCHPDKSGRC
jgi:hypothetical protein